LPHSPFTIHSRGIKLQIGATQKSNPIRGFSFQSRIRRTASKINASPRMAVNIKFTAMFAIS
jgi:hypothetical protein